MAGSCRVPGQLRGRRSRRHVVVRRMAVGASHAVMGVLGGPPLRSRCAGILLVTLQAQLGPLWRLERLEAQNRSGFSAAGLQMAAGRSMTLLARLAAMDIVRERLDVGFMARRADLVVVNELGIGDLGSRHAQRIAVFFPKLGFGCIPVGR